VLSYSGSRRSPVDRERAAGRRDDSESGRQVPGVMLAS
jgi:hypothetical protein